MLQMEYLVAPVRNFASWLPEFNYGMLVLSQSAIFETFFFHGFDTKIEWEKMYQKPTFDAGTESFGLRHVALHFIFWSIGIFLLFLYLSKKRKINK